MSYGIPLTFLDLSLSLGVLSLLAWLASTKKRATRQLPPGPQGWPFIGNVFDRPKEHEWITYAQWSRDYDSDVVSTLLLGNHIIILNSAEAASDLFEKRSSIYSGRPPLPMMRDLMDLGWGVPLMPYSDFWRRCRKLMHHEFNPEASVRYHPQQTRASHELMRRLLRDPAKFMDHIRHMTGDVIISATYGIDVLAQNDPYIDLAERVLESSTKALIPGAFLVDLFPLLKHIPAWVPGAGFQKFAQHVKKMGHEMADKPLQEVKRRLESQTAKPSYVSCCLDRVVDANELTEHESAVRASAASMYGAGADTTVSSISSVILGLLSNPSILKRAQKEIEQVVGTNRLPALSDREDLPCVSAIVYEALRWNPVVPLGVVHQLSVEDEYKGYRIPANSMVVGNIWSIMHDETLYPDPFVFNPERFLKEGKLDLEGKDPVKVVFGFGRRICPGRYVGVSSTWIAAAQIIAAFDISKATDENGHDIEPSYKYSSGFMSYPEPFVCSIIARSANARKLIEDTLDSSY